MEKVDCGHDLLENVFGFVFWELLVLFDTSIYLLAFIVYYLAYSNKSQEEEERSMGTADRYSLFVVSGDRGGEVVVS